MGNNNDTRDLRVTKIQRQLTVKKGCYAYQGNQHHIKRSEITEILLKGKWLAKAGFQAGQHVIVRVIYGCLVLTKKE